MNDLHFWQVSDLFHRLKNIRTGLFKGDVYSNDISDKVLIDVLKYFIRVKVTLCDKSYMAKMKDKFTIDFFLY